MLQPVWRLPECHANLPHLQAYVRMKASDAWETLEAKVAGTETAFQVFSQPCSFSPQVSGSTMRVKQQPGLVRFVQRRALM